MAYEIVVGRSEEERQKLGLHGTVFLGKHYVKMGRVTSLSNEVYMDITRAHVVFICGKRGSGKCLDGDTRITLNDGTLIPIKDLASDDREVMALNGDLKIAPAQKSEFYQRTVSRMLSIRLRTGREIKLTPEHPLLTVRGWSAAETLPPGSRIATPRKLELFGEQDMGEASVKLLAYLIAEGHLGNRFILFSNTDAEIVADFKEAVHAFDPALRVYEHSNPGCFRVIDPHRKRTAAAAHRNLQGQFARGSRFDTKNALRKWLEELRIYGRLSRDKFLPNCLFTLPQVKLALFLNRLFSCDGSLYKSSMHWGISYSSASRVLISQVQHLLLRFSIVARVREKHWKQFTNYELEINGEGVSRFLQQVGFFGSKTERQRMALRESAAIRRNPNLDTIPREVWEQYQPENWAAVGRALGYAHPKSLRESMRYAPSRQKLLQIAIADDSAAMEQLATSDIYWDEIVAVEELTGTFTVYDITVPEHHNFVANDIIVHNSYTMGAISEGMADLPSEIRQNLSFIMLDTMGVYWTMKYPNKQDKLLLDEWGFKAKGLNVVIFTPYRFYEDYKAKGIPTDFAFAIKPSELSAWDWQQTFDLNPNSPVGVLIERVINHLQEEQRNYDIPDIITALRAEEHMDPTAVQAAVNRFESTTAWGVFRREGTLIKNLAMPGQVSVLDVSAYATMPNGWKIKSLIIGLVAQKLFIERMTSRKFEEYTAVQKSTHFATGEEEGKLQMPLVWLVVDEAHEFLPREGTTAATFPLITILREGRQPGISLILASQQPGKINTDVMTQSDIFISHRITAKVDVEALGMLMQSYMREGLDVQLDNLPREKGAALVFDDTNERLYAMKVRPRFTWHGGGSPTALPMSGSNI